MGYHLYLKQYTQKWACPLACEQFSDICHYLSQVSQYNLFQSSVFWDILQDSLGQKVWIDSIRPSSHCTLYQPCDLLKKYAHAHTCSSLTCTAGQKFPNTPSFIEISIVKVKWMTRSGSRGYKQSLDHQKLKKNADFWVILINSGQKLQSGS